MNFLPANQILLSIPQTLTHSMSNMFSPSQVSIITSIKNSFFFGCSDTMLLTILYIKLLLTGLILFKSEKKER